MLVPLADVVLPVVLLAVLLPLADVNGSAALTRQRQDEGGVVPAARNLHAAGVVLLASRCSQMCCLTNRLSAQRTPMPPRRRFLSCC